MSNLPGLSLGSRFWDKASAVTLIQTDRSFPVALRSSRQYLIAGLVFFGRLALWGSNPLCEWVLANFVFRVPTFHRGGEGWWGRNSKVFEELLWLSHDFKRDVVAELQLQPGSKSCLRLLSCGIDFFFGESVEVAPRQTNTVRKTKLGQVFDYSELMCSVNFLVLFTFCKCDYMPLSSAAGDFMQIVRIVPFYFLKFHGVC